MSAKQQAIVALTEMEAIVESERLIRGTYISAPPSRVLKKNASLCGGERFCAIGALWAGYGIEPQVRTRWEGVNIFELPGSFEGEARAKFTRTRPGLRLALGALNEEARVFIDAHGPLFADDAEKYDDLIEGLFESCPLTSGDLLEVVRGARARVEAA